MHQKNRLHAFNSCTHPRGSETILIFKDEVLMYKAENASSFADFSLKRSCLCITSSIFYIYFLAACASQADSL
jgi:hypothetical protein